MVAAEFARVSPRLTARHALLGSRSVCLCAGVRSVLPRAACGGGWLRIGLIASAVLVQLLQAEHLRWARARGVRDRSGG